MPHKITISPIVELPFGEGKKWAQSGVGAAILGDWTFSSIIGIESGFPIALRDNSNDAVFTRLQRANSAVGQLGTSRAYERIAPPQGRA